VSDVADLATAVFSDRDRAILEFERMWWKYPGAKHGEVLTRFGMSATRYYQVLGWILRQPEAVAYDAQLVQRLRRLQEQRAGIRKAPPTG
jgi:hypothetical protein